MPLKNCCSIHARWSKSSLKHSIRFCGIFPSLKQNFIAYHSSRVSDCTFEIHQLWQSGFSRVYSNCCSSCSFEPEIIKISQSSYKMYSNKILNFQESGKKKFGNLSYATRMNVSVVQGFDFLYSNRTDRCVLANIRLAFKCWSILFAFHIALISLGKV